jgi:hypothetical protein
MNQFIHPLHENISIHLKKVRYALALFLLYYYY